MGKELSHPIPSAKNASHWMAKTSEIWILKKFFFSTQAVAKHSFRKKTKSGQKSGFKNIKALGWIECGSLKVLLLPHFTLVLMLVPQMALFGPGNARAPIHGVRSVHLPNSCTRGEKVRSHSGFGWVWAWKASTFFIAQVPHWCKTKSYIIRSATVLEPDKTSLFIIWENYWRFSKTR